MSSYPRPLFLSLLDCPPRPIEAPARAVLCLGNFDGVHIAHTALLHAGAKLAHLHHAHVGAFCFFRPSSDMVQAPAAHLCTLREKLALLADAGMEFVCLIDFETIRDMPAEAFPDFLRQSCACHGFVCGFNYRYGAGAAGNAQQLKDAFSQAGDISPVILPAMELDGEAVSSSRIRAALRNGEPELAARLLGRPYALEGQVVSGKRLGRQLGFPTANQFFPAERLIPAHGVYASRVTTPSGVFPGVTNIGIRPTVESVAHPRANCETYIIGYTGDLYGQRIRVELCRYLRPERHFADLEQLRTAIAQDAKKAEELQT